MPFCPQCRSEYREGFETCASCNTLLVAELEPETLLGVEAIEDAVADGTAVAIARGGFDAARQMRDLLGQSRVAAVIVGDPGSCDARGVCSSYDVLVTPEGVEPARNALAARFQDMLMAEGLGSGVEGEAIDLTNGDEINCPACGTPYRPAESGAECPDCGLNLGIPEG